MITAKLIIGLLLATVLVVFGAQNTQSASLRFLAWDTPEIPLVVVLALTLLAGVLLSWLVSIPGRFRNRRERHELQHQVDAQQHVVVAPPSPPPTEVAPENRDRPAEL